MEEVAERITLDTVGPSRDGHEARYHLAAGYCQPGDTVLDAACGIGYGAPILNVHRDIRYLGVDRAECWDHDMDEWGLFIHDNLETWHCLYPVDVTATFETIEHLIDPERFIARICEWTHRTIIASVPTVPTTDANPHHLHDFTPVDLPWMFDAHGWHLTQYLDQPAEQSGIYVFNRG